MRTEEAYRYRESERSRANAGALLAAAGPLLADAATPTATFHPGRRGIGIPRRPGLARRRPARHCSPAASRCCTFSARCGFPSSASTPGGSTCIPCPSRWPAVSRPHRDPAGPVLLISKNQRGRAAVGDAVHVGPDGGRVWNTVRFYQALRGGQLHTDVPLPFSLHVAATAAVVIPGLLTTWERFHFFRDFIVGWSTVAACASVSQSRSSSASARPTTAITRGDSVFVDSQEGGDAREAASAADPGCLHPLSAEAGAQTDRGRTLG